MHTAHACPVWCLGLSHTARTPSSVTNEQPVRQCLARHLSSATAHSPWSVTSVLELSHHLHSLVRHQRAITEVALLPQMQHPPSRIEHNTARSDECGGCESAAGCTTRPAGGTRARRYHARGAPSVAHPRRRRPSSRQAGGHDQPGWRSPAVACVLLGAGLHPASGPGRGTCFNPHPPTLAATPSAHSVRCEGTADGAELGATPRDDALGARDGITLAVAGRPLRDEPWHGMAHAHAPVLSGSTGGVKCGRQGRTPAELRLSC